MPTLRDEIHALAAEMLTEGRAQTPEDARTLAHAHIDATLRYADQADKHRLTDPAMEAITLVNAALQGYFKLI